MSDVAKVVSETYKTESSKLLAVLVRIFGTENFQLAEDVLQEAFAKAVTQWTKDGIPDTPAAWILTTAKNRAIDQVRTRRRHTSFASDLQLVLESEWTLAATIEAEFEPTNIKDDLLKLIFLCCHEQITLENRLPFILRSLCSFDINAISKALLIPEATTKKRLLRTKQAIAKLQLAWPELNQMHMRMHSVHTALYLLFNEGFHSTNVDKAVNKTMCREAINLVELLIDEPRVCNRDTLGLYATILMLYARIDARVDSAGDYIPVDMQERGDWDQSRIEHALKVLALADGLPQGGEAGRFLIEAKINREHAIAPTFEQTNWQAIIELYDAHFELTQSPVALLSQAVALAYANQLSEAFAAVEQASTHKALAKSHTVDATLAHLYSISGDHAKTLAHIEAAKAKGCTPREHKAMLAQAERNRSR